MYYIETREQDGSWTSDVGDANEFATEAEARRAIVELITMTVTDPVGHNYSTDPDDYRIREA